MSASSGPSPSRRTATRGRRRTLLRKRARRSRRTTRSTGEGVPSPAGRRAGAGSGRRVATTSGVRRVVRRRAGAGGGGAGPEHDAPVGGVLRRAVAGLGGRGVRPSPPAALAAAAVGLVAVGGATVGLLGGDEVEHGADDGGGDLAEQLHGPAQAPPGGLPERDDQQDGVRAAGQDL